MAIKGAEELDGVNFYEQIQKVRDGYAFLAVHYQQDESEASEPLKKGKFVLVHQDGHKDQEEPILTCYKGGMSQKTESQSHARRSIFSCS